MPATTTGERRGDRRRDRGLLGRAPARARELRASSLQKESIGTGAALTRALEKLREQRALVEALREAPDYRPRRQVRPRSASRWAWCASAAACCRPRTRASCAPAREHLDGVLAQLDAQPPPESKRRRADGPGRQAAKDAVLVVLAEPVEAAPDGDVVLRIAPASELVIPVDGVQDAIRSAVEQVLAGVVREETTAALARARGRVD
jgi:hypothetical protein